MMHPSTVPVCAPGRRQSAFTLIELLVVMIIIAILMAIAVPTFMSQKSAALKTKAIANIKQVENAIESCAANYAPGEGGYSRCLEHAELVKTEPALKDILDVWNGGPTKPGDFDVDAIETGNVIKAPVAGKDYPGYIVSTWIQDSGKRVFFADAHMADGSIIHSCGEGTTDTAAPSGGVPNPGSAVTGSKTCLSGRW
jgi:prepilin-type N-terminal cleavage/methylation domain-containing protein